MSADMDLVWWASTVAVGMALAIFFVGWLQLTAKGEWRGRLLHEPPALPGPLQAGWWKVPADFYNRFDVPLMALLVAVYALPPLLLPEPEEPVELGFDGVIVTIALQVMMAALVVGFVSWRRPPSEWLGLRWRKWPLVVPISIGAVLFTWLLMGGLAAVVEMAGFGDWLKVQMEDGQQEAVKAFQNSESPLLLALLAFTAVIVAPVTEEILFRGYLYPAAKQFAGRLPALISCALVFAVAHNNLLAMVPLFFLAIVLTLAYEWTGSIWAPIGIHMLFNGATVVMQFAMRMEVWRAS